MEDSTVGNAQIEYRVYTDETQLPEIMSMMAKDLSEPYSIYTYRYFLMQWPNLCILAFDIERNLNMGAVVCREEIDPKDATKLHRGYIAMLAVNQAYRRMGVATQLVVRAIEVMRQAGCQEVGLETEITNDRALKLYSKLGFIREQRLRNYYLNGVDAFRLKLTLKPTQKLAMTSAEKKKAGKKSNS